MRHNGGMSAEQLPLFAASAAAAAKRVLTVTQLTAEIKETLEETFPTVNVSGEISNLSRPASGHYYFTLKDAGAQLRCVMFRSAAQRVPFAPQEGLAVICRGPLEVFAPKGSYQLIVQQLDPQGEGAKQLALRQLRERLAKEGLFEPGRKRPLPKFPRRVGFVTSPTGAAIRDFLEVARRRWPGVRILVIPARVQGEWAAGDITLGIERANRLRPALDVLVIGRGGGSLEDLWCFNEERVVRAIHASRVPVVSAVGHEIDVTLADLVADVRALTPSEAAERVVPSMVDLTGRLRSLRQVLDRQLRGRVAQARSAVESLARQRVLRRPLELVHDLARRVDELEVRAGRSLASMIAHSRERIAGLARSLESLSPLAVLGRGYSLTQRADTGELVRDAAQLAAGDVLRTRLAEGEVISRVEPFGVR